MLLLILVATVISIVMWRTAQPSRPTRATVASINPTSVISTASASTTANATARQNAPKVFRTLRPAIDDLIQQYATQGITRVGVVIEDDRTGETLEQNADALFASASLYKLFVLWRTQIEIRQGRLSDGSLLPLTAANDASAEDGYVLGPYGDTVTVADLRRLMISSSSNTAAQVLAQWFGLGTIEQLLRANGFTATSVLGEPRTTAREVTRFLEGVVNRNLDPHLQPDDYALMLTLLKEQQVNTKLSIGFPDGTVFAHKTGDIPGAHHDAGVIFLPDGRSITITVLTGGDYDASVRFQHDLAELLWQDQAGRN